MKKFDKKRDEIKNAGIKSFATYGYYKTTLEDIASVLGMKKNSLYYYFENKEALFHEIIEDTVAKHLEQTNSILNQALSAAEKMLLVTHQLMDFILNHAIEYCFTITSFMEMTRVIRNSFPDFQQNQSFLFKSILEEGITNKEFKKHNTTQLAADLAELIPAIFSQHYIYSESRFISEVDFNSLTNVIDRIIGYILVGIKCDQ